MDLDLKSLLYLINLFAGLILLYKIYSSTGYMDMEMDLSCQTKVRIQRYFAFHIIVYENIDLWLTS